jgi:hypothetical protein
VEYLLVLFLGMIVGFAAGWLFRAVVAPACRHRFRNAVSGVIHFGRAVSK